MKLTLMNWSGSCTCWTRSDGLIMSRIAALRSWKSASCLRLTYFVAREPEGGRLLLDRGLDVLLASVDRVHLRQDLGLLLLEGRERHRLLVELLDERVEVLLGPRRGARVVGELVLVLVALGVEGGLGELVLLVGQVDLRVEVLRACLRACASDSLCAATSAARPGAARRSAWSAPRRAPSGAPRARSRASASRRACRNMRWKVFQSRS